MKSILTLTMLLSLVPGCASKPPMAQTGFLDDYSRLQKVDQNRMRYISPQLRSYAAFIVDPIEFEVPARKLDDKGRAEIARYFRSKLKELLQSRQFQLVNDADVGVARIRIAMTDVAESTWWKKLHPVLRATGAGTGGAACEGEVIDSISGEQLAAWISSAAGSQFDFTAFSTVADVKSVIDRWITTAGHTLDELRASRTSRG